MNSVGSFFSQVSKLYNEINPATLSGAIDVVVVEQADGELACSPFHVRFGKLSILRPQEKIVEVVVNGKVCDFPMKVGNAGEAFFVFETTNEVPEEFATSPLAGPTTTTPATADHDSKRGQDGRHNTSTNRIHGDNQAEDDIDFLDLTAGGLENADRVDADNNGYVSAHSGHGSEFGEDDYPKKSPAHPAQVAKTGTAHPFGELDSDDENDATSRHGNGHRPLLKTRPETTISDGEGSKPPRRRGHVTRTSRTSNDFTTVISDPNDGHSVLLPLSPRLTPLPDQDSGANDASHLGHAHRFDQQLYPGPNTVILDMTGYKSEGNELSDDDSEGDFSDDGGIGGFRKMKKSPWSQQPRKKRFTHRRPSNQGSLKGHALDQPGKHLNSLDITTRFPAVVVQSDETLPRSPSADSPTSPVPTATAQDPGRSDQSRPQSIRPRRHHHHSVAGHRSHNQNVGPNTPFAGRERSSSLPNVLDPPPRSARRIPASLLVNEIHPDAPPPVTDDISPMLPSLTAPGTFPHSELTRPTVTTLKTSGLENEESRRDSLSATTNPSSPPVQAPKKREERNAALNAVSDTEFEYQTPRTSTAPADNEWTWGWGSLPVKNTSSESMTDGVKGTSAAASPPPATFPRANRETLIEIPSPKPKLKPVTRDLDIGGVQYRLALSLCPGEHFGKDVEASELMFAEHQVSFEEFSKDPKGILQNKNLVVLINDRYLTWTLAGPVLLSLLMFHRPIPEDTLQMLSMREGGGAVIDATTGSRVGEGGRDMLAVPTNSNASTTSAPNRLGAFSRWLRGSRSASGSIAHSEQDQLLISEKPDEPKGLPSSHSADSLLDLSGEPLVRTTSLPIRQASPDGSEPPLSPTTENSEKQRQRQQDDDASFDRRRYAKTLRLTSEQLKSLNLQKGANTLEFSVTSAYQGKATCKARLFYWEHNVQVVISDIDGTITKSDALGHLFTMAGKDWTHLGVAKLYTDITNNGYHILYLTSRAIGQADHTRKYLKGVEQNKYQLPDGPVIMSPDRLMTALHREVIMRKPEVFKMACLRDLQRLFGGVRNPFYAGFGNRITDAMSYRSVDIPSSRIFTIDSGGEVKLELLSSYKSSYIALNDLVNEIFPGKRAPPEFNDWNFWRQPLAPSSFADLPLAPSTKPVMSNSPLNSSSSFSLSYSTVIDMQQSGSGGNNTSGGLYASGSTTSLNSLGASSGGQRLGVIRSFTSSLSSGGPLKRRPSVPVFPAQPTSTSLPASAIHTPSRSILADMKATTLAAETATAAAAVAANTAAPGAANSESAASGPPVSGSSLSSRTRRLSLSLMKYGSQAISSVDGSGVTSPSILPLTSPLAQIASDPLEDELYHHHHHSSNTMPGHLDDATWSNNEAVETTAPTSPPISATATVSGPRKSRGFSVSTPQIASRISETVLPFLRSTVGGGPSASTVATSPAERQMSPSPLAQEVHQNVDILASDEPKSKIDPTPETVAKTVVLTESSEPGLNTKTLGENSHGGDQKDASTASETGKDTIAISAMLPAEIGLEDLKQDEIETILEQSLQPKVLENGNNYEQEEEGEWDGEEEIYEEEYDDEEYDEELEDDEGLDEDGYNSQELEDDAILDNLDAPFL